MLDKDSEGWFGEHATKDVMQVANAPLETSHKYEDMFVCNPNAKYHGYKSWDGELCLPLPLNLTRSSSTTDLIYSVLLATPF